MTRAHQHPLERILESGIAIIAGVTGISIRTYGVAGADFRGERFKNSIKDLKNNGDVFSLTQLQMFCDIHRRVLEAGDVARNKRCRWSRCVSGRIMDIQ
jgi:5-methyltetrahydrofolate--homocysteine methyltransferase